MDSVNFGVMPGYEEISGSTSMRVSIYNQMRENSGIQMQNGYYPSNDHDVADKLYVDTSLNFLHVAEATPYTLGTIQLSGDLSGSATNPIIADGVVSLNKISPLNARAKLIGSDEKFNTVTQITLGDSLEMNDGTLNVSNTEMSNNFISKSGDTMNGDLILPKNTNIKLFEEPKEDADAVNKAYVDNLAVDVQDATVSTKGILQLSGDLSGTASLPLIAKSAITLDKLANLKDKSRIIGSTSSSTTPSELKLGEGLILENETLNINTTPLKQDFLPLAGGTMSGYITMPTTTKITIHDLPMNPTDAVNKRYVDTNLPTFPNATASVSGGIQLGGDLTGTFNAPVVRSNAITRAKMAPLPAVGRILGSTTASTAVTDLIPSNGISMNSNTLRLGGNITAQTALTLNNNNLTINTNGTGRFSTTGDIIVNGATVGRGNGNFPSNLAFGANALRSVTSDSRNVGIGFNASPFLTSGFGNVGVGANANYALTTGSSNVTVGENSSWNNTTGNHNVSIGQGVNNAITTGSHNVAIGNAAGVSSGNLTNTISIGQNARCGLSNMIRLGSTAISRLECQVPLSISSDLKYKSRVKQLDVGLDFIQKLKPIEFTRANETTCEWGFAGQDIEIALTQMHCTDSGIIQEDVNYGLMFRPTDLIAVLVNAIKELNEKLEHCCAKEKKCHKKCHKKKQHHSDNECHKKNHCHSDNDDDC